MLTTIMSALAALTTNDETQLASAAHAKRIAALEAIKRRAAEQLEEVEREAAQRVADARRAQEAATEQAIERVQTRYAELAAAIADELIERVGGAYLAWRAA